MKEGVRVEAGRGREREAERSLLVYRFRDLPEESEHECCRLRGNAETRVRQH